MAILGVYPIFRYTQLHVSGNHPENPLIQNINFPHDCAHSRPALRSPWRQGDRNAAPSNVDVTTASTGPQRRWALEFWASQRWSYHWCMLVGWFSNWLSCVSCPVSWSHVSYPTCLSIIIYLAILDHHTIPLNSGHSLRNCPIASSARWVQIPGDRAESGDLTKRGLIDADCNLLSSFIIFYHLNIVGRCW